jgi:hypothetical protein
MKQRDQLLKKQEDDYNSIYSLPNEIKASFLDYLDQEKLLNTRLISTFFNDFIKTHYMKKSLLPKKSLRENEPQNDNYLASSREFYQTVNRVITLVYESKRINFDNYKFDDKDYPIPKNNTVLLFDSTIVENKPQKGWCFITNFRDETTRLITSTSTLEYIYEPLEVVLNGYDPLDVVKALLKRIDDPNKINTDTGQGLLHYFIGTMRYDVIEYLLKAGLSLDTANVFGETPIHIMFEICTAREYTETASPSIELLQLLIDHHADFKKTNLYNDEIEIDPISDILGLGWSTIMPSNACLRGLAFLYQNQLSDTEQNFIDDLEYNELEILDRYIFLKNIQNNRKLSL